MTMFDNREQAQENKFAYDAEKLFKARVRRNRLAGLWLAEVSGQSSEAGRATADRLAGLALAEAGDEGLVAALKVGFSAAGAAQSEHGIRRKLESLMAQALAEVDKAS